MLRGKKVRGDGTANKKAEGVSNKGRNKGRTNDSPPLEIKKRGSVDSIFYNTKLAKSLAPKFDAQLKRAGIPEDARAYASRFLFFMVISVVVMFVLLTVGLLIAFKFYLLAPIKEPKYLVLSMIMVIFGAVIPLVSYLGIQSTISQKIESLRIGLDSETPVFSAVFLVYLRSGLSPGYLFEQIAEGKAFNYVRKFASYVTKRVKYLGEGIEDALYNASEITPSALLSELAKTYVTAVRTGAPVTSTIQAKVRDLMRQFQQNAARAADSLSGVAEGYVIWLSSGYIFVFLTAILSAIFPSIALPINILAILLIFVIPLVNFVFIYIVEQIQLKFPESAMRAYKTFYMTFPIGVMVSIVLFAVTGQLFPLLGLYATVSNIPVSAIDLAIGLIIAALPPYIVAKAEFREGTGYDDYIVRFLRAVGEGLRAGLSPEAVLSRLKDAPEMGKLRKILSYIHVSVRFGVPLKDSFKRGADRIRDFTSKVALLSLADMLEVGSITPETIETIAQQIEVQVNTSKEYKSKVRILIATPYVALALSLLTSVLLGSSILSLFRYESGAALSYGPLQQAQVLLPRIVYLVGISSIVNAFFAGLFVGKIQSGKIASGFLHAIILTLITVILVILTPDFSALMHFGPSSTAYQL